MAHADTEYLHGDLVLKQRNTESMIGAFAVHDSNATYCSNHDTVGINSIHSFPKKPSIEEARLSERLKMKIENVNKHWMYSWILSIQDLESWYHKKQTKGKTDRGLSSIFTFKGGKSHALKKIREKSHELQMKMVDPC